MADMRTLLFEQTWCAKGCGLDWDIGDPMLNHHLIDDHGTECPLATRIPEIVAGLELNGEWFLRDEWISDPDAADLIVGRMVRWLAPHDYKTVLDRDTKNILASLVAACHRVKDEQETADAKK